MYVTYFLPCHAHVKVYLEKCFGCTRTLRPGDEPVKVVMLRGDSSIGEMFYGLVRDGSMRFDNVISNNYKETCIILITEDVMLRIGMVLTKTNVRKFNRFVDKRFREEVNIILDAVTELGDAEINSLINDYIYPKYGMDEYVIAHETLRKSHARHRRRLKDLLGLGKRKYGKNVLSNEE